MNKVEEEKMNIALMQAALRAKRWIYRDVTEKWVLNWCIFCDIEINEPTINTTEMNEEKDNENNTVNK